MIRVVEIEIFQGCVLMRSTHLKQSLDRTSESFRKKEELERQKSSPRVHNDPNRVTDEDLRLLMIDLPKAVLAKAEKDGQFNWKLWTHLAYFNIAMINGDK